MTRGNAPSFMPGQLPYCPARFSEEVAAQYLGVSQTKFRERVAAGTYPQPVIEGRRKLWSRDQLDIFVAVQFNLPTAKDRGDQTWADCRT